MGLPLEDQFAPFLPYAIDYGAHSSLFEVVINLSLHYYYGVYEENIYDSHCRNQHYLA